MSDTIEDRVTRLEARALRHEDHFTRLDAAVAQVNTLTLRELSDRVGNVEARLEGVETLLGRIVDKLGA
jgi:uncharacterized coiled-coil protein SlyX